MVDEEVVLQVLESAGAPASVVELARRLLGRVRRGELAPEEAYYAIVGAAFEELVPLGPRDVGDIREALGLPRRLRG